MVTAIRSKNLALTDAQFESIKYALLNTLETGRLTLRELLNTKDTLEALGASLANLRVEFDKYVLPAGTVIMPWKCDVEVSNDCEDEGMAKAAIALAWEQSGIHLPDGVTRHMLTVRVYNAVTGDLIHGEPLDEA